MKSLWNYILKFWKREKKQEPVKPDLPDTVHAGNMILQFKSLTESCKINNFRFDASGFWGDYSGHNNWASADGLTCGWICMTWQINGKWYAEYWDGMSRSSPYHTPSMWHITDPTAPFSGIGLPKTGDKVGHFYVSEDGRERSNIAWGVWPL